MHTTNKRTLPVLAHYTTVLMHKSKSLGIRGLYVNYGHIKSLDTTHPHNVDYNIIYILIKQTNDTSQ